MGAIPFRVISYIRVPFWYYRGFTKGQRFIYYEEKSLNHLEVRYNNYFYKKHIHVNLYFTKEL